MVEQDKLGKEDLSTKQWVLRDDLKRMLIYWQLMKYSLESVRTSETLKEWAELAKTNRNKHFVDFRKLAADQINSLNAMIFKMKTTIKPHTWNVIMSTLTSEQVKEIDLLLNEITELREDAIERITGQIKEAKIGAGIPLNNPNEQYEVDKNKQPHVADSPDILREQGEAGVDNNKEGIH